MNTKIDVEGLRAKAEGATKGEWALYSSGDTLCIDHRGGDGRRPNVVDWPGFDQCDLPVRQQKRNAAYIVAAQPQTMIALLDRIAELEVALTKLANEVAGLASFEGELRAEIGNTNWNVLALRMTEAHATLSGAQS